MQVTLIRGRGIKPSINKIARALATHGYSVKLLIWDRDGTAEPYNTDLYPTYKCTLQAPYDRPAALLYLPLWWAYELVFLLRDDSDVIQACDFDTLLPAILAKLIGKRKLCYFIYDFYADNLFDRGFQWLRNRIRSLVAHLERTGIGFADVLFLVDESRLLRGDFTLKKARIQSLLRKERSGSDTISRDPAQFPHLRASFFTPPP